MVDGINPASTTQAGRDPAEWRLASADPRDPGRNKYRLHTLDIYFWTQDDAKLIIEIFKRLLNPSQLDIVELEDRLSTHGNPTAANHDNVSSVVQNLENMAISDPAYQNGKTRNSQTQAQNVPHNVSPPLPDSHGQGLYLPTHRDSPVSDISNVEPKPAGKAQEPPPNFVPLAYNPAAPPAPEPIAHREDTPPPPDADDGTGLAAAAQHDQRYPQQMPSQHYSGIPSATSPSYGVYGAYGSTSPQQHRQYSVDASSVPSFASSPTMTSQQGSRHPSIAAQTYAPPPPDPQAQMYDQQPVETPGTQFYSSINTQSHKPLQHVQPQYADYLSHNSPPPGGYAQYSYSQNPQLSQSGSQYDVHSQVYRPTENEMHSHHKVRKSSTTKESKLDQASGKVEGKVGKFFKKIEKAVG